MNTASARWTISPCFTSAVWWISPIAAWISLITSSRFCTSSFAYTFWIVCTSSGSSLIRLYGFGIARISLILAIAAIASLSVWKYSFSVSNCSVCAFARSKISLCTRKKVSTSEISSEKSRKSSCSSTAFFSNAMLSFFCASSFSQSLMPFSTTFFPGYAEKAYSFAIRPWRAAHSVSNFSVI